MEQRGKAAEENGMGTDKEKERRIVQGCRCGGGIRAPGPPRHSGNLRPSSGLAPVADEHLAAFSLCQLHL